MNRHGVAALIAVTVVAATSSTVAAHAAPSDGGNGNKTSICHRTASDSNPYVFETVADASLPAHLNDLPGHPSKYWKSDGTWRGVAHVAGDPRDDYVATSAADCQDTTPTQPPGDGPTVVVPNLPVQSAPDCRHDGSMMIPLQPDHVTVTPRPGNRPPGDYVVTFTATPNDGDADGDDYVFEVNGDLTDTITLTLHVGAATGNCPTHEPTPTPSPSPTDNPSPTPAPRPPHNAPTPHHAPSPPAVPVVIDAGL